MFSKGFESYSAQKECLKKILAHCIMVLLKTEVDSKFYQHLKLFVTTWLIQT